MHSVRTVKSDFRHRNLHMVLWFQLLASGGSGRFEMVLQVSMFPEAERALAVH